MHRSMFRNGVIAVATTLAAALLMTPVMTPATANPAPAPARPSVAKTNLTINAPGCNGCKISLNQGLWKKHGGATVWQSKWHKVRHGKVTFRVPTRRTHGMSIAVMAPWEGATGYMTNVAFRYAGLRVGDHVTFRTARSKHRASACWTGTHRRNQTLPLTIRKVRVEGTIGRVPGTIAYATTTRNWMRPMRQVWRGVMGSQDVNICGRAD